MNYKNGFVTFIDILGFKKIVSEKSCDEVSKIIEIFYKQNVSKRDKIGDYKYEVDTISFSDSIIRASILQDDFSSADYCESLLNEIVNLSCIQMNLIREGILIRGGIDFGEISFDSKKGIVFGTGFVDAYTLESQIANFPRIVISPDVFDNLEDFMNGEDDKTISNIIKCLSLDKDGIFYVNYLKQSMSLQSYLKEHKNGKVAENVFYEDMKAHKKLIVDSVNMKMDIRTQQKYNWLTSYHNEINSTSDEDILSKEDALDTFIYPDDNFFYRDFMNIWACREK